MKTIAHVFLVLATATGAARGADDPIPSAIFRLGAEEYKVRESAQQELIRLAEGGYEPLLKTCAASYRESKDPEVRHRLHAVMKQVVDKYPFRAPRGFLGVTLSDFLGNIRLMGGKLIINGVEFTQVPQRPGIWVTGVTPDSGAAKAGMQPNDIVIGMNGKPLEGGDTATFTRTIQAMKPGTAVKLTVQRAAQTNEVAATLGEMPAEQRARLLSDEEARLFFADWWEKNIGEPVPEEK